jgi:methionyl-tRNA formyltransferase
MRVVFIGSSKFGLRCLKFMAGAESCELVGAVTAPQEFSISYRPEGVVNVLHAEIQKYCEDQAIPCVEVRDGMKDILIEKKVKGWRPEVFIVSGWYHMLPKSWRIIAPAYGLHASLLPDYSGGAPLTWAMISGEPQTGITLFQLAGGVDNGPIIGQAATVINDNDDIASLYARIEGLGLGLLAEYLPQIFNGTAEHHVQNENCRRIFPQRSPEDGLIDWNCEARSIWNFIRAQTKPYPGAFSLLRGKRLRIWSSRVHELANREKPLGCIYKRGQSYFVQCASNHLELIEVDCEGEKYRNSQLLSLLIGQEDLILDS